jgi:hypothetical protein
MSEISAKETTLALPPQRPGVPRLADASGWLGSDAVQASRSCGDLTGPARSMCYSMQGVTY